MDDATQHTLESKLSGKGQVVYPKSAEEFSKNYPRWSEWNTKLPATIVKVTSEKDIIETVKYAARHQMKVVVKAGGHSNSNTIENGIAIDLTSFNQIKVDTSQQRVTVQPGALGSELIEAVSKTDFVVNSGTAAGVGVTGLSLGGGINALMGQTGFVVDNFVSARVVTAAGNLVIASAEENEDLFWAIRGAGRYFGIVTELTLKLHPKSILNTPDGTYWSGMVVFTPDQAEQLAIAIEETKITKKMFGGLVMACMPPLMMPSIAMMLYYYGPPAEAEEAYAPFFRLGPIVRIIQMVPYRDLHKGSEPFCVNGGYKAHFSYSLDSLSPQSLVDTMRLYAEFVTKYPDASQSSVFVELLCMEAVKKTGADKTALPHRDCRYFGFAQVWCNESATIAAGKEMGKAVRQTMQAGDTNKTIRIYANYAHGDEPLEQIFAGNLPRLRVLKKKWDPETMFFGLN